MCFKIRKTILVLIVNRKKKIRKHRGLIITPITLAKISRKLKSQELHEGLIKNEETFPLTEVDGLTKIYKTNRDGEIYEITCVSLEIKINNEWITIIYYDSFHNGLLHKHVTVSMADRSDSPTTDGVRKKGTQRKLLTWAIKDITANYFYYKRNFFRRSKISFKDTIDMQYK